MKHLDRRGEASVAFLSCKQEKLSVMAEIRLEDAPRKARDYFEKGFGAMERGSLDYAMDMFMLALDIEPRLLHARKYLRGAALKKAKDKKPNALTHILSSIAGLGTFMSASGAIKKKPMEALNSAEKLMRADPLNLTFINLLGRAAVAAGLPEVAIQTLEIARDHYPKNVELLKWLGNLYIELKNTRDARLCFEAFYRLRPNDPKALKALKDSAALDTMQQGGWNDAGSYRDVMKDTKESGLLEQAAKAVKSTDDLDNLIQETKGKLQREPDNINYRRTLADYLTRAERFDEALRVLREVQQTTGRADPQLDRNISMVRTRKFDHEIEKLHAAGNSAGVEAMKKEKDAFLLDDAVDRVKRYPNDLQFHYELGVLLFERGSLNEAIQEFQLSQRNPQRRIRSLYYMAMCFKQKKQYDIALEQLQKAISELFVMDDTKKDICYEMAQIGELMGQPDKAVEYYKKIYSVDIGYKDVSNKIEKAYKK
jgi:tetratricopeptide (TPR) repeat protein